MSELDLGTWQIRKDLVQRSAKHRPIGSVVGFQYCIHVDNRGFESQLEPRGQGLREPVSQRANGLESQSMEESCGLVSPAGSIRVVNSSNYVEAAWPKEAKERQSW